MELTHEKGRIFALDENGEVLCEITFPDDGVSADINHTFVSDALRGQGMAGKLVREALEQMRTRGLKAAKPSCSYAAKWLETHEGYEDILA